jgi:hypothetical protein
MVKVIVLNPEDLTVRQDLVGTWLDESHYKVLVEEDMDLYLPPNCANDITGSCDKDCNNCESGLNEKNIVFKFRKNYFTKEEVEAAYDGLRDAAVETNNRGYAAGPRTEKQGEHGREWVNAFQEEIIKAFKSNRTVTVDGEDKIDLIVQKYRDKDVHETDQTRGRVWLNDSVKKYGMNFDEWIQTTKLLSETEVKKQVEWLEEKCLSKTTYASVVNSGIAGWYDRYPRIPYGRPTSYTRDRPETFALAYPYIQKLSEAFKDLLPWRYNNQKLAAEQIDQNFVVPETPFTTLTVNRNFRTAAHYDPANMENGFANLCVISKNDNYSGAYLVFPEIGYAVNIRPGDLLFVNNQAGLHGNTELILHDDTAERVSMIAFFHEGMLELGTYEYEETRRDFVELRRLNPDHPDQRIRWNGIGPGMWADKETKSKDYPEAKEWLEHLNSHPKGAEWIAKYHPWTLEEETTTGLEAFF